MRASTKIAIGGAVVLLGGYFGWQLYAQYEVDRVQFPTLRPGQVNIVGVNAGQGYKITVANEVANLVQLDKDEQLDSEGGEQAAMNKRRVPLREMLASLQGDEQALGKLVVAMNEPLRKLDMPPVEILWAAEDIRKALEGDKTFLARLEADLNVHIDGKPLDKLRISSLSNGIVVASYVPIEVTIDRKRATLKAPIKVPFKANFVVAVGKRFEQQFNPTKEAILGYYLEEAAKLKERPGDVEDVRKSLLRLIDEKHLASEYAFGPEKVLANTNILINETHIKGASSNDHLGAEGRDVSDITLTLTDEGRKRLWQYSRRNVGAQLLVIGKDGIAIAAPRIRTELADGTVTIRNVANPGLAKEAVDSINKLAAK